MNMPMNFGQKVEEKTFDNELIPKNTLLWCVFALRGIKNSRETNGQYLDVELTVYENQPYAKRKLWTMIGHPFDANNKEEYRNMGYAIIRRILEATKGANPQDPNSYVLNSMQDLHGLVVPIIVGVQKGNKEYPDDKNIVEFLSPHSSIKKIAESFKLLSEGKHLYGKEEQPKAPVQGSMFNGTAAQPPVTAQFAPPVQAAPPTAGPGWLAPATNTPVAPQPQPAAVPAQMAPPAQGFPQGVPPAQPQQVPYVNPVVPQQPVPTNTAPAAMPVGTSPSNPAPVGQWPQAVPPAQFPGQGTPQG